MAHAYNVVFHIACSSAVGADMTEPLIAAGLLLLAALLTLLSLWALWSLVARRRRNAGRRVAAESVSASASDLQPPSSADLISGIEQPLPSRLFRLACPHCSLPACGAWRKLAAGWGKPFACQHCGLRVEPSGLHAMLYSAPLIVVSLVLAVLLRFLRTSMFVLMGCLLLLALLMLLAMLGYVLGVPLMRAGISDRQAVLRAQQRYASGLAPGEVRH